MATNGQNPLDNFIKCFSNKVLEGAIDIATRDEDTGREMLKWMKEKRTNLATNYKNVQVFFEDELGCENIDEELKYNPKDTTPTQIQQIADGLKHVLCTVRKEIKDLLFSPNLKINEEYMERIAARKKTKKRKGNLNSSEKFLKKARLDEEQTDSQNPTDGQSSVTQNRVLKEIITLDKQKTVLTNEKENLKTCVTELNGVYSHLMDEINTSNREREEVETKLATERAELESIKKEAKSTENSLDKLKKEKAEVEKILVDEKAELTELRGELDEKERILDSVDASIAQSEEQLKILRKRIRNKLKGFEIKSAQIKSLFKENLIDTISILDISGDTVDSETHSRKKQLKGGHSSKISKRGKKKVKNQAQGIEALLDSSSDDHDKLVIDI